MAPEPGYFATKRVFATFGGGIPQLPVSRQLQLRSGSSRFEFLLGVTSYLIKIFMLHSMFFLTCPAYHIVLPYLEMSIRPVALQF